MTDIYIYLTEFKLAKLPTYRLYNINFKTAI